MSEENKKQNPEVNEATLENVDGGAMQPGVKATAVQIPQPLNLDNELARTADPDRLQRTNEAGRLPANEPDKLWW